MKRTPIVREEEICTSIYRPNAPRVTYANRPPNRDEGTESEVWFADGEAYIWEGGAWSKLGTDREGEGS